DGYLRQRQGDHGADLVDQRPVAPAADGQQTPAQAEHQLDDGGGDEGRNGAAGGRQRNDAKVGSLVLPERSYDAERAADQQRQDQRGSTELRRDRQALGKQFADGEIRQIVARTEIA